MKIKITWKSCLKIFVTVLALCVCIFYIEELAAFVALIVKAVAPILVGIAIAYVLNILMSFYERHYFKKFSDNKFIKKSRRPVCLIGSMLTLVGIIAAISYLVIPELVSCIKFLFAEVPGLIDELLKHKSLRALLSQEVLTALQSIDWMAQLEKIAKTLTSGIYGAVDVVVSVVSTTVSTVVTGFISIIFSIYLLTSKENMKRNSRRLLNCYLPEKITDKVFYVGSVLNRNFHKFIVGQCTDAVIIGVMCAIGMLIFRFPYAGMIGALVGFTALIPVAGAYIGAIVGAIMMLTESPLTALLFIVFIIVLQQLEGNLIYPKIVGGSIGLPAIWVLAAITVGGTLMGILGMLIGVPIAATLYQLLHDDVLKREDKKSLKAKASLAQVAEQSEKSE